MTASAPPTDHQREGSTWALVHAERAALAEDLALLDDAQWRIRRYAGGGWSRTSSPTSPRRRASAPCAGSQASWVRDSTSTCTNDRRLAEYRGNNTCRGRCSGFAA